MWKNVLMVYVIVLVGGLYIGREMNTSSKVFLIIVVTLGCAAGGYIAKIIDWQKLKENLAGPK